MERILRCCPVGKIFVFAQDCYSDKNVVFAYTNNNGYDKYYLTIDEAISFAKALKEEAEKVLKLQVQEKMEI